jgi:hypothetical protein
MTEDWEDGCVHLSRERIFNMIERDKGLAPSSAKRRSVVNVYVVILHSLFRRAVLQTYPFIGLGPHQSSTARVWSNGMDEPGQCL